MKGNTVVGVDGFHVPLDLSEALCEKIKVKKVQMTGMLPERTSTTLSFAIPNNVVVEGHIALLPTLMRW